MAQPTSDADLIVEQIVKEYPTPGEPLLDFPFDSTEDLARSCSLGQSDLQALARSDALAALAGLGLIRGSRASVFAMPMLIWVPLMSAGVLGGFVFIAAAGDEIPVVVVAIVGGLGLVSAILATAPLVRRPTQARNAAPA